VADFEPSITDTTIIPEGADDLSAACQRLIVRALEAGQLVSKANSGSAIDDFPDDPEKTGSTTNS